MPPRSSSDGRQRVQGTTAVGNRAIGDPGGAGSNAGLHLEQLGGGQLTEPTRLVRGEAGVHEDGVHHPLALAGAAAAADPLCRTALWKRPRAWAIASMARCWRPRRLAEDRHVLRVPPNAAISSFTQARAASWSSRPSFPVEGSASPQTSMPRR